MGKFGDNSTAKDNAGPAERHPCLSADFDERLEVARKQREKVLAERAAAAAVTGKVPFPTVTIPRQPAWDTRATQDEPQIKTLPDPADPGPIASIPGLYRNPRSLVRDSQEGPQSVKRRLQWIAGAALIGILVGSIITLMLLESWSTHEADIVSRAASQPDVSWPVPLGPTITSTFMVPDRSPWLAVPQTDIALGKSTTSVATLRPPLDTPPPETKAWSSQPTAPAVQLNMPRLDADPSGAHVGIALSSNADLQAEARAEPMQQLQNVAADGKPSLDLDSLAPTLAMWDMVMTAPRQDQSEQVIPLFLERPDYVAYHPALRWPASEDDFDCQDCQMTALPAEDQTIILFVSDTSSTQQRDMMSRLSSLGLAHVESHQTRLGASETNVRYFHDSDAAAAKAVARSAKARLVDLSALRPLPPVGTIELRLGPDQPDIAKSSQFSSDIKG